MKDRAVCVMSVGSGRHFKQYELVRENIRGYAHKCRAEFVLIDQSLDPGSRRDIFSQKLLIPSYLGDYRQVLFLDTDILISPECPDIFELMPEGIGLMAEVNPRGTERFRKIYAGNERILNETVQDYFTARGFAADGRLVGNINGGVLLFRPALVADLFEEYYYSGREQGQNTAFEEAPMAYLTQTHGLFLELDRRFNCMPYFEIGNAYADKLYATQQNRFYRRVERVLHKLTGENHLLLTGQHFRLVRHLFDEGAYIVHFAGGYWNSWLYRKMKKCLYP